jgi:NAD(P)H-binding
METVYIYISVCGCVMMDRNYAELNSHFFCVDPNFMQSFIENVISYNVVILTLSLGSIDCIRSLPPMKYNLILIQHWKIRLSLFVIMDKYKLEWCTVILTAVPQYHPDSTKDFSNVSLLNSLKKILLLNVTIIQQHLLMKFILVFSSFLFVLETCHAFSPIPQVKQPSRVSSLFVEKQQSQENKDDNHDMDTTINRRRSMIKIMTTTAAAASITSTLGVGFFPVPMASAASTQTVVVAGATGQTGRRILERLASMGDDKYVVIGGVRNVPKAEISLQKSSTVLRGAMIQKVSSVDITSSSSPVQLQHLDVVQDSVEQLTATLQGATSLIIAIGFVPGINPLDMSSAAHAVDNVGTCKLIDAAKATGTIKKIVLVSSILTNGRNWGQEKSPGFVVTNAFGNVLDEKIVAENYLRSTSGIDYTIVRPGGLKAKPPTGPLHIYSEDTLNAGEVSRDLVADVCIASLTDPKASNKVLEIIEDDDKPPQVFNGLNM